MFFPKRDDSYRDTYITLLVLSWIGYAHCVIVIYIVPALHIFFINNWDNLNKVFTYFPCCCLSPMFDKILEYNYPEIKAKKTQEGGLITIDPNESVPPVPIPISSFESDSSYLSPHIITNSDSSPNETFTSRINPITIFSGTPAPFRFHFNRVNSPTDFNTKRNSGRLNISQPLLSHTSDSLYYNSISDPHTKQPSVVKDPLHLLPKNKRKRVKKMDFSKSEPVKQETNYTPLKYETLECPPGIFGFGSIGNLNIDIQKEIIPEPPESLPSIDEDILRKISDDNENRLTETSTFQFNPPNSHSATQLMTIVYFIFIYSHHIVQQ